MPHYHMRLTRQVKLNLVTWQHFLTNFNCKAFFLDENVLTGDYLQSSRDIVYGAVCGPEWILGWWSSFWRTQNLTILEWYLIVVAVELWGGCWANSNVTLPILAQLIRGLPNVLTSHCECVMLRAMMVLAFRAYLRACEMVPRSSSES